MTNIPRDLLCDPSEQLSARFLQDPRNLYGLHGTPILSDTDPSGEQRWLTTGRRYASLMKGIELSGTEPRPEDGLLPPIEPEVARLIGEIVGTLYQAVTERFRSSVDDLGPVTE